MASDAFGLGNKGFVVEVSSNGRIRHWYWVEQEQKYLRVILLADGETVHNAFFDRSFKEKQQ